jgi:hypothetical protein
MRAEIARRITCVWIGFWALTPVCGPYPQAPPPRCGLSSLAGSFLPWACPLSGMRAQPACIQTGSTPFEIIKPRRRYPRRHSARGLTFAWSASAFFARRHANFPSASFGLMPCPSGHFEHCPERATCLRFCTCRERDALHRDSRRGAQPTLKSPAPAFVVPLFAYSSVADPELLSTLCVSFCFWVWLRSVRRVLVCPVRCELCAGVGPGARTASDRYISDLALVC